MKRCPRHFWKWMLFQVCGLLVFLAWKFWLGTSAYLNNPNDSDSYAHTWSYQGIVFCIFRLLPALVGMGFILGSESFLIRAWMARKANEKSIA